MFPAEIPAAVSSDALMIYCVFAPPQPPGKKVPPAEVEFEAPAPIVAAPLENVFAEA